MTRDKIDWLLIANLPADGDVYNGGPEYGASKVCHKPADKMHVECLLAETGTGLHRRRLILRPGKPSAWGREEWISGGLAEACPWRASE